MSDHAISWCTGSYAALHGKCGEPNGVLQAHDCLQEAHVLHAGGKRKDGNRAGSKAGARKKLSVRDRLMKKLRLK